MGKRMEAFMEVVKINFKMLFQYKWTFAMSLFTQPIIFIINYIIFQSIYTQCLLINTKTLDYTDFCSKIRYNSCKVSSKMKSFSLQFFEEFHE